MLYLSGKRCIINSKCLETAVMNATNASSKIYLQVKEIMIGIYFLRNGRNSQLNVKK